MSDRPSEDVGDAVDFDPEAVLERDARVLLDPSFMVTLHAELSRQMEPENVAATLLQMGFLHGLQDVTRALAATTHVRSGSAELVSAPLRMPCRRVPGEESGGSLVLEGTWPGHREAAARTESLGAEAGAGCHLSEGYTSGWLSGAFDTDLLAIESHCHAEDAEGCHFVAREVSDWEARGDVRAEAMLAALPFARLRAQVRERAAAEACEGVPGESYDVAEVEAGSAAVHIWGPVMVLPYAGPDETLHGISLLSRDPNAEEVSVVVVDFGGALLDEAFGALALEQLVQRAEAHGAETIFVDVSPMSELVIEGLAHPPLMLVKDLDPAIALAFQIAQVQKRRI